MNIKGKNILVTGGTGLIGRELVQLLMFMGAQRVRIVSLDDIARAYRSAEFIQGDLRDPSICRLVVKNMDIVFHLMGNKGSPKMAALHPADMFVSHLLANTNMMEAAFRANVGWYLFTSSVGVYAPCEVMQEDSVWTTMPSPHDWFPGWAKRMGELQADAYRVQAKWNRVSVARPANVYGPYDNYDPDNAMVIPSLVRRIVDGENPLHVWGDGHAVRDFIHARDVAIGMIEMVKQEVTAPVNLGSGCGVTIRELVETLVDISSEHPAIEWDTSKPSGDNKRLFDTTRAEHYGIVPKIDLRTGLNEVYHFYKSPANREIVSKRYSVFNEK